MSYLYECRIMGRLGRDAELSQVDNGSQLVKFSVCYSKKFKRADKSISEELTWFECNYWRRADEDAAVWQYLKKGDLVMIDGTVGAQGFINTKTEEPSCFLTFRVSKIYLLPQSR